MQTRRPSPVGPLLLLATWLASAPIALGDLTPPDCLEAVVTKEDTIRLQWKPVARATQYSVTCLNDGKVVYHTPKPSDDPVLFEDGGRTPGTTYHYTVKAWDQSGKEPETGTASVLVPVPAKGNFVYAQDYSKYEPSRAEAPWFGGAWRPADGVLRQEQDGDADRIRKLLFVRDSLTKSKGPSDSSSPKVPDERLTVRITTRVRVEKYDPRDPAPVLVGLGMGTDVEHGNGYAFVFYDAGRVAFINDPYGATHSLPGPDGKTNAAMNDPIKGQIYSYNWEPGKDYWVSLAWSNPPDNPSKPDDPRDPKKAYLEAKIWPACGDKSSSRKFEQKAASLIQPIKIKNDKGEDTGTTDSTARASGYPALVGGYKAGVKSTFDDVLIEIVPTGTAEITQKPTVPTASPCPPGTSLKMLAKNTSRDSISRGPRVRVLTDDKPEDSTDDDERAFEPPLPEAKPVPTPTVMAAQLAQGPKSATVLPDYCECPSPVARLFFDGPASFPLPEFGTCGEFYEHDAAVIHEGMRLLANKRGDYLVRFNISAPAMPVYLRLQMTVQPDWPGARPFQLTLPPIRIDPDGTSPEFFRGATYGVSVPGHSEEIRRQFSGLLGPSALPSDGGRHPQISRAGAARFGVRNLAAYGSIE